MDNRVNIITLRNKKKDKTKAVLITAYDYPQSILVNKADIDVIIVGDSLAMTTLGYKTTIPVTMDQMISHAEAVVRGNQKCFLVGDMPFGSYQESNESAVRNASRFIVAGMDAVKIEGDLTDRVKAMHSAGIVVMSHLGLTPQSRALLGGYRVQGKTKEQAELILGQAQRLQDAGCSFLLLEAMPRETAAMIAEHLDIPVYGIGAGDQVDGQLVIFHDLVGLFFEFKSKFVKRYCEAGQSIIAALKDYRSEVINGQFPAPSNFYEIKEDELEKMLSDPKWKYVRDEK